jgi:hypothetical protein
MSSVYGCAYVTLVAVHAKDSSCELFAQTPAAVQTHELLHFPKFSIRGSCTVEDLFMLGVYVTLTPKDC